MGKKVVIVGTGLGGLATALRLTSKGYQVEMVEKHSTPGGRLNQLITDGFTFDLGPSFFSMSYEFTELFKSCGIPNPLKLKALDPLYAVHFRHRDKPFLIWKDLEKLALEFEKEEPGFADKMQRYLNKGGQVFHDTENIIIRRNHPTLSGYIMRLASVPVKHLPMVFRSLWDELCQNFSSDEVRVIFSLVAFFLGATPFDTPAVYSLLSYTELVHDGYWNVEGGMYKITESIVELLQARGVKITYNTEIVSATETAGKLTAFTDQNGNNYKADIFVANSDAASFRGKVLKRPKFSPEKLDKMDWTLAPFTIYLGVMGKIPGMHQHNYFLGSDFKDYSVNIFKNPMVPENPYYYVNVSSLNNPDCAPEGCENLFILCPVPDLRRKPDWSDARKLANNIIDDLSKRINFPLKENLMSLTIYTPADWEQQFNLYRGSGLGLAHGLNQTGALRPANRDEQLKNLYYTGASTVPGTGLPMVVISSALVTERIVNEQQ